MRSETVWKSGRLCLLLIVGLMVGTISQSSHGTERDATPERFRGPVQDSTGAVW